MKRYDVECEREHSINDIDDGQSIRENPNGKYCLASEVDTEIDLLKKWLEHSQLEYSQVLGSVGLLHEELKYADEEIRDKDEQITKMCEQAIAHQNEIQKLKDELYVIRTEIRGFISLELDKKDKWFGPESAPKTGEAFLITTAGPQIDICCWDKDCFRDYYYKQEIQPKWPYMVAWMSLPKAADVMKWKPKEKK